MFWQTGVCIYSFLGTLSKKRTTLRPPPKKTKSHTDTSGYMYNIINPILKKQLGLPPRDTESELEKSEWSLLAVKPEILFFFFFSVGSSARLWYLQRYVKSNFFFRFATVFRLSMQDIRLSATEWNVFFFLNFNHSLKVWTEVCVLTVSHAVNFTHV